MPVKVNQLRIGFVPGPPFKLGDVGRKLGRTQQCGAQRPLGGAGPGDHTLLAARTGWGCRGGTRNYTLAKASSAVRSGITSIDPFRVTSCWLFNSPSVRVTVSREVPII